MSAQGRRHVANLPSSLEKSESLAFSERWRTVPGALSYRTENRWANSDFGSRSSFRVYSTTVRTGQADRRNISDVIYRTRQWSRRSPYCFGCSRMRNTFWDWPKSCLRGRNPLRTPHWCHFHRQLCSVSFHSPTLFLPEGELLRRPMFLHLVKRSTVFALDSGLLSWPSQVFGGKELQYCPLRETVLFRVPRSWTKKNVDFPDRRDMEGYWIRKMMILSQMGYK